MLISWLWAATAQASPLCDTLLQPTPPLPELRRALAAGDDPNEPCRWTGKVPAIQTFGGLMAAVFLPVISWPIVFTEEVNKKRSALPLSLALDRLGDEGVALLLDAGARPYDGALEEAVARDRWEVARRLIEAGATPILKGLGPPLAGDLARLDKLEALGIRLDQVTALSDRGKLLTDPIVAARFLENGLPAEVLLAPVVERGSPAVLELCLGRINPMDPRSLDALRSAAVGGRWEMVDRLRAVGVPWEMIGHEPVLIAVISGGSVRNLDRVLHAGADPAARDPLGHTALQAAVSSGRADLVVRLLDAGAPIDDTDTWGDSALSDAAGDGRADLVSLLLARGASPIAGNPLLDALSSGQVAVAGLLVAAGAPVDDETVRSLVDDRAALRYLLGHGLSADRQLGTGETLAVLAIRNENTDVLRLLVDAGAPLDGPTPNRSALRAAIATDAPALVERVLALGADPAEMPLQGVWQGVDGPMEAVLLDRLRLPPPPDALVEAARASDVARVRKLLSLGADPNAPGQWGDVALDRATDPEIERLLLAAGARLSYRQVEDAVRERRWPYLERLGVHGRALDPFLVDTIGRGDPDSVGWLLAHGADPNAPGGLFGERPLSEAIERRDLALVAPLLAAGASVAHTDPNGDTVLHQAVDREFPEAIAPLVAAGARLDIPDAEGRTPMQLALERWNPLAVEALLAAGHPYAPLVRDRDLETCRTDRLTARVAPGSLTWTAVRPQVRGTPCRGEIRRWLRAG